MKIIKLIPAFLILIVLFSSCKKNKNDQKTDNDKFALPVWDWSAGAYLNFTAAPVPAIDEQDNSYYLFKTDNGDDLMVLSLDNQGKKRWLVKENFPGSNNNPGSVILSGNRLYFYSGSSFYCYNKDTGNEIWHFEVEFPASAFEYFIVKNDEVWLTYTYQASIILQKLNSNGEKQWKTEFANYSFNLGMASFGNKLVLLNKDLYAYHVDVLSVSMVDGSKLWTTKPDIDEAAENLSVDGNGNIYFTTYGGELLSLDGNDGSVRWTYKNPVGENSRFVNSFSVTILPDNDVIFPSGYLICLNDSGKEKWRSPVVSYESFTLGNQGVLYGWGTVADTITALLAIDASTGEQRAIKYTTLNPDLQSAAGPLALTHKGDIIAVGSKGIHCVTSLSTALEENAWAKIGKGYQNNSVR